MEVAALAAHIEGEIAALPKRDTPHIREIRKAWSAKLKGAAAPEVIGLALLLAQRRPQETKWIAYELIRFRSMRSGRFFWGRCGPRGG